MNALLEQIYCTGTVTAADGQKLQAFPMGVDRSGAEALYRVVRENNLRRTLEIGMAYGLSSLAICQALRDNGGGLHITIDPWQSSLFKSVGMLNLKRAELDDLVELREQPSHLALSDLLWQGQTFELVFIDGSHLFDYVTVDFFYSRLLVPVGGWICMDDMLIPGVASAFAFIVKNLKMVAVVEKTGRYCILRKVAEDNRAWNYFEPF